MRIALCGLAACVLFAVAAPVVAEEEKVDWAKWNTWKAAAKGDWVEYAIAEAGRVRYEIVDIKSGKITYKRTNFDTLGKETASQELTKAWNDIKLMAKLPYGLKVTWDTAKVKIGDKEISCDTATYTSGETTMGAWYSKDVPCGGVVKALTDGNDTVWLTAFASKELGEVKVDGPKPEPEKPKSKLPKFFQAEGNSYQVKIVRTGKTDWQLRTVKEVLADRTVLTVAYCDEAGNVDAGRPTFESTETEEKWLATYAKADESAVKVTVPAGEFTCDLFKTSKDGTEIQKWLSDGVLVKQVAKSAASETQIELVKLSMK